MLIIRQMRDLMRLFIWLKRLQMIVKSSFIGGSFIIVYIYQALNLLQLSGLKRVIMQLLRYIKYADGYDEIMK